MITNTPMTTSPETTSTDSRPWRLLRAVLLTLGGLVTVTLVFYGIVDWRGHAAWDRMRQAAEAHGEKLEIAALAPPAVPDDQNLAMCPMLKPALDYAKPPIGPIEWRDNKGYQRLEQINCTLEVQKPPRLGLVAEGATVDLAAWQTYYRGSTNYPQPSAPGRPAADILLALSRFDGDLAELRREAAARPLARFPVQYASHPAVAILLRHLSVLGGLSRLLQLRTAALLDLGRSQEAQADLELNLRLSDAVSREPILVSQLVRKVILERSLETLREGITHHVWTDAQLAGFAGELGKIDMLAEEKLGMQGEQAFGVTTVEELLTGSLRAGDLSDPANHVPAWIAMATVYGPRGWLYQNMAAVVDYHQRYNFPTVDVKLRRVFPDLCNQPLANIINAPWTPSSFMVHLFIPALGRATARSAQGQTMVDAARVACAVERFRLAAAHLPAKLEELVPKYLDQVPTDVIDGQPLRYHPQADGEAVIYSIGWNQRDDDGHATLGEDGTVQTQEGDWVWTVAAK